MSRKKQLESTVAVHARVPRGVQAMLSEEGKRDFTCTSTRVRQIICEYAARKKRLRGAVELDGMIVDPPAGVSGK